MAPVRPARPATRPARPQASRPPARPRPPASARRPAPPPRTPLLGPLWGLRASSLLAAVGEGIVAVALPLLTTAVTRDPLAVAAVVAAAHLPWVVVTLLGGQVLPRLERRTVLGTAHSLRGAAVAALAWSYAGNSETIGRLVAAAFAIGLGEALADHVEDGADQLPSARPRPAGLARALRSGGMVALAVVGLPLGGFLYELLPPVPFVASVFVFCLAGLIALLPRVPLGSEARSQAMAPPAPLRLSPGTTRPTAVAALQALGTSAVLGVLVLFALDDLGLGAPSFGVLLGALAAGSAVGGLGAPEFGRVLGGARAAAAAALTAAVAYGLAAVLSSPSFPLPGAVALVVGAAAAMATGVLARADLHARGGRRLGAGGLRAFHLVVWSAIPVGAVLGGLVAELLGVAGAVAVAGAGPAVAAAVLALAGRSSGTNAGKLLTAADKRGAVAGDRARGGAR
jgi:predicted MFS family arabinose efflux permease